MRRAALACLLVGSLGASAVEAQVCMTGRIETIEGYCCWPAQTWSAEHQRCIGPPMCPNGMSAEGDDCVGTPLRAAPPADRAATVVTPPRYGGAETLPGFGPPASAPPPTWAPSPAPPPPPPIDLSSALAGTAWPEATDAPGSTNPRREPQLDSALLGAGIGLVVGGYVMSIGEAVVAFESEGIPSSASGWGGWDSTCHDAAGALFLVPIVGAILGASTHGSCSVPVYTNYIGVSFRTSQSRGPWGEAGYAVVAAFSSALQLAGGIMAVFALLVPRSVTVFDPPTAGRVSLAPHGSPTSFGIDLRIGWL